MFLEPVSIESNSLIPSSNNIQAVDSILEWGHIGKVTLVYKVELKA